MNIPSSSELIRIHAENTRFEATLAMPASAKSIIIFAHGAGSSSHSPRNRLVARSLFQRGFAILLPNLVDETEDSDETSPQGEKHCVSQIAIRLSATIDWLIANPKTSKLDIGLFGSRTGAGAAMIAAALRPKNVHAIISRGGRPDLADEHLQQVLAPTLMIVGSKDHTHIDHNRKASEKMRGKPMLELIPGASHLFGEPGKLEQVASMSNLWFQRTLALCG
ncbi:MAG: dienelactone hydrolase family protein [Luteolibacter sp.]